MLVAVDQRQVAARASSATVTSPRARLATRPCVTACCSTSADVGALDLQPDRPHELEHLDDDRVGHLRLVDDVGEQRLRVRRVGHLPAQQAGHHLDAGQRVLHLVRDARGHLAERRQPIAQPLAFLELLDPRQVLEEQRRADRASRRRPSPATACSRSRGPGRFRRSSARFGRWLSSNAPASTRMTSGCARSTSANGRPTSCGAGVRPKMR